MTERAPFYCTHCDQPILLGAAYEGKEVLCPHCEETVSIPEGAFLARPGEEGTYHDRDATLSIVFGSVGIAAAMGGLCCVGFTLAGAGFGAAGWYLAHRSRVAALRTRRRPDSRTTLGLVLSIGAVVVAGLWIAFTVVVLVASGNF